MCYKDSNIVIRTIKMKYLTESLLFEVDRWQRECGDKMLNKV